MCDIKNGRFCPFVIALDMLMQLFTKMYDKYKLRFVYECNWSICLRLALPYFLSQNVYIILKGEL